MGVKVPQKCGVSSGGQAQKMETGTPHKTHTTKAMSNSALDPKGMGSGFQVPLSRWVDAVGLSSTRCGE